MPGEFFRKLLEGFVDGRSHIWGSTMSTLISSFKRLWGLVAFLDHPKPAIPLRGRIRISLSWDFRGDR
jgi:hypothetical protein